MRTEESFRYRIETSCDIGRGGDGRPLSPRDNEGPDIIDCKKEKDGSQSRFVTGLAVMGIIAGVGGAFFIDGEEILTYLKENELTPEQLTENLLETLRNLSK